MTADEDYESDNFFDIEDDLGDEEISRGNIVSISLVILVYHSFRKSRYLRLNYIVGS